MKDRRKTISAKSLFHIHLTHNMYMKYQESYSLNMHKNQYILHIGYKYVNLQASIYVLV